MVPGAPSPGTDLLRTNEMSEFEQVTDAAAFNAAIGEGYTVAKFQTKS